MADIRSFRELRVWQAAMDLAMEIFELSKRFPVEERYSLTDQIRRSSRSVPTNIAEAWRRRRYSAAFVSKLNDSESEGAETQTWLEFSSRCKYMSSDKAAELDGRYETLAGQLVHMAAHPEDWVIRTDPVKPKPPAKK